MNTQNNNSASKNGQSVNAQNINTNLNDNFNAFEIDTEVPQHQPQQKTKVMNEKMDESVKAPVQKTDQNLDLLLRNAEEIDTRTKDLLIKNRTLIQQLFPSKMDKLVQEMQVNTVHAAMEFRLNLYKMSTKFRLEALREKYNAALMTIRGHYREQVSEFMMGKLMELHQKVDIKQRGFIELAKSKYEYAKLQQGYPNIQALYLSHIDTEFVGFMTFLGRQVSNFESIIDEQIEKFG